MAKALSAWEKRGGASPRARAIELAIRWPIHDFRSEAQGGEFFCKRIVFAVGEAEVDADGGVEIRVEFEDFFERLVFAFGVSGMRCKPEPSACRQQPEWAQVPQNVRWLCGFLHAFRCAVGVCQNEHGAGVVGADFAGFSQRGESDIDDEIVAHELFCEADELVGFFDHGLDLAGDHLAEGRQIHVTDGVGAVYRLRSGA